MQKVIELDDVNFDQEVKRSTQPVIVVFSAKWCGSCKKQMPIIEELSNDYAGKARVCRLNVDEGKKKSVEYSIKSIPTILIFKNGKFYERLVGFTPKNYIAPILNKYL